MKRIILFLLMAGVALMLCACGGDDPGKPETPETPETPENPETPQTPETPENPENPENPGTGPVTYSVTHDDLWLANGEQKIYGVLYRPEGLDKAPLIIISHGFAETHSFGTAYAEALAPLGYAVYCFDFCGGSNDSLSDGKTTEMSVCSERADLTAVIAALRELDYIDPDRIILIGDSQGGFVSALVAADHKDLIEKLVLIYPAFCIQDDWVKQYPQGADIPETIDCWGTTIGRAYVKCLYGLDIYGTIAAYEGPVQIFHGDQDEVVALSYSKKALEAYKNASLKVMTGEGHGFSNEARDTVIETIKEFLQD